MMTIEEMVSKARKHQASDIHLVCNLKPKYRIDGSLENMSDEILSMDDCLSIARFLAGNLYEELMEVGELDLADTIAGNRCRIHLFKQQGVPSLALRILNDSIPVMEQLNLPPATMKLVDAHKGIVLITGETGSGKSTTLAAMIDRINHTYKKHIVTLEDPVEYIYSPDLCIINQREIGKDTRSFSEGLRASLREDPDVILIGEMRDKATIETAITAAETGHLVFGTLHTSSAAESIDRIVQVFDEGMQRQIRLQLSTCLMAVLAQQLIPKKGYGRILACEYMPVTDAIRNMIRSGNTPQIANAISTSEAEGGQSLDQALVKLFKKNQISKQTALHYARNLDYVTKKIH